MLVPRYKTWGKWYKGNTHMHSNASDGGKNFAELAEMYISKGYSFLFRTDHWVCSNTDNDDLKYPLLWLDGLELDGIDKNGSFYHVVCLGKFTGINKEMGFSEAFASAKQQGGIMILAHPFWSGNSFNDALALDFHGVEIYNHVCHWLNGKSCGTPYWNAMLERGQDALAFAADDAHVKKEHPGWDGGWICVNIENLNKDEIHSAISSGNFYSSQGPEIHSIKYKTGVVSIKTSPVRFIRLVGKGWRGSRIGSFDGELVDEAAFIVPEEWPYAYIEIEDVSGKIAWTNSLYREDELSEA